MNRTVTCLVFAFWTLALAEAFAGTSSGSATEFDQGIKAYDAGQYKTAFEIWWKIKNADLAALRNVALMLRKGLGVQKDPQKAQDLFEIATNAGLVNAEVDLAEMLLTGEAGPPNPKRAIHLLQEAAASHHPLAEYLLGQLYEVGNGVPKDTKKATGLYIAAAEGGVTDAKARLASLDAAPHQSPSKSAPRTAAVASPSFKEPISAKSGSVVASAPPPTTAPHATSNTSLKEKVEAVHYSVQVGSFKSAANAEAAWTRTGQKQLLAATPHQVKQVDLGQRGTWYRLLMVGFKDHGAATTFCDRLRAASAVCLVIRSDG